MMNSFLPTNLADGLNKPASRDLVSKADVADGSAPVDEEVSIVGDLEVRRSRTCRLGSRARATGSSLVHLQHKIIIIIENYGKTGQSSALLNLREGSQN